MGILIVPRIYVYHFGNWQTVCGFLFSLESACRRHFVAVTDSSEKYKGGKIHFV